jgi:hypothetical protein
MLGATGMHESDQEFVNRILRGEQQAWAEFVDRFTDWVFYKANRWTRRETFASREETHKRRYIKSEKAREYSEAAVDAYIWIFQQLRNKLRAYSGKAALSTYVWAVLNAKYLLVDFLRWRYDNPSYLPKAIQVCAEIEQKVFAGLRARKPLEQIAAQLALPVEQVEKIQETLIEKLIAAGQEDLLLRPVEIELSDELKKILAPRPEVSGEERLLLEKVAARFAKSLERLSPEDIRLLQMFYNEELTANEILAAYQRLNMSLPSRKAITESTPKDVFKAIERIKARLLPLFQAECRDLREAIIDSDTVNTFLDQLGVQLA